MTMKFFKLSIWISGSLLMTGLATGCNANAPDSASPARIENKSQTKVNAKLETVPEFVASAKNFQQFVNDKSLDEEGKYPTLEKFFEQSDNYSDTALARSFADVGSKTAWNVDLISFFAHDMAETIKKRPQILCQVANTLTPKQMNNYVKFYIGNVIWNDDFPKEFFELQSCNPQQFQTTLTVFQSVYKQQSTRKRPKKYRINDKDGTTNLRSQANPTSPIVGTLDNGTVVTPMWAFGKDSNLDLPSNWLFVIEGKKAGYVYLNNLTPVR